MNNQSINYEFENYRLLSGERLLLCDGRSISLKPKVFETLLTLVQHHGELLTKDQLMQLIWSGNFVEEGNLSQYIFTLRKIFGETPQDHRFIVTVPGHGYRFVARVRELNTEESTTIPTFKQSSSNHIKSLAVLPLRFLNTPENNRYLGLAIADTLITQLGNNRTLIVRPTATIIRYMETELDPMDLGRELAVEAIVHGTILETNGKIRVNIQMTNILTYQTIWANRFEGETADLMSFQDQIVEQVAGALPLELNREAQSRKIPQNPEVYQNYLKARFFWESRTEAGLFKSLNSVMEVVTAEPDFPLGYIGIADCYLLLGEYLFLSPDESFPKARLAAEKALKLEPSLAEAYASLGDYFFYYAKHWEQADSFYRKALQLDPNYATAFHWYSWFLIGMGRYDEALLQIEQAQILDPNSLILSTIRGLPFYYKKQYEQAINQFRHILEIDPNFRHARYYLGSALIHAGYTDEAIVEFEKIAARDPMQQVFGLLGYSYAIAGKISLARDMLKELDTMERERYVSPYIRAFIHTGLGDKEKAIALLEKAFNENAAWLVWLNADPFFNSLRNETKFRQLIEKLRFPQLEISL